MSPEVIKYIDDLKDDFPGFDTADVSNISATNSEGENALHIAIHRSDTRMARLLIEEGIDIHQPGDLGHTPLHEACSIGNFEIVRVLVEHGADLFALTEGNPPFTLARFGKHDAICDYLAVEMKRHQSRDPAIWRRARIEQLRREIGRLEKTLPQDE